MNYIRQIMLPRVLNLNWHQNGKYSLIFILKYFETIKNEYISLFDNFFYNIFEVGLTSYNIYKNLERISAFNIQDYVQQLKYPEVSSLYDPTEEYIYLDNNIDMNLSNERNFYYSYKLKSYSKIIDFIDSYFIKNINEYTNRYFAYKPLLKIDTKNETDIINQWKNELYSPNNVTSSFEFKLALEWEIFSNFYFEIF